MEEFKKLIAEMNTLWGQMKAEMAKNSKDGKTTSEALEKMHADMDAMEKKMADLETKMNRPPDVTEEKSKTDKEAKEALQKKEAFRKFLTKGVQAMTHEEQKSMIISEDIAGGYLAPPEFINEVIKNVIQFSPIREEATVRTTSSRLVEIPTLDTEGAASWGDEQNLSTEIENEYGLLRIPVNILRALFKASQTALEDAISLEADIMDSFSRQFRKAEGAAFLTGTGVKSPEGIITHSAKSSGGVGVVTSTVSGKVDFDDLDDLEAELMEEYRINAKFFLNRYTLKTLKKVKDNNGQYLWQPRVDLESPATILGYPYRLCGDLANIASNAKPIIFGDMRQGYRIYDRKQIVVDVLRELYHPLIGYSGRQRVGGQVVLPEALKVLKVK